MSRSGYTDDCDDILAFGRWNGMVASAIRGKRGQAMLSDLRDRKQAINSMFIRRRPVNGVESIGDRVGVRISELED